MENMQYAEELLREFLVFRGFTSTLQAFESELSTDIGKGFQVDRILELIFSVYVPKFQAEKLVGLLNFFKQCISSTEMVLITTISKLEVSILRYYIVHAIQFERKDKLTEFFGTYGNDLLQSGQDWMPWFAIPYLKNPSLDPQFCVYFSREWFDTLHLSFRNFLSEIFNGTRIPTLLKISTEKNTVKRLKKDIRQLNDKLSQLQALLEDKDAQLCLLRSMASSATERGMIQKNLASHPISETLVKGAYEEVKFPSGGLGECKDNFTTDHQGETEDGDQDWDATSPCTFSSGLALSKQEHCSSSTKLPVRDGGAKEDLQIFQENGGEVQIEEEFPEVKVEFQETFLGHTSPISRCRFSATGNNIASASLDGTVRIWTYDSSTSTSRNATIYCGAEIMSLDWECKSDRLAQLMGALKCGMLMQKELFVISIQVKDIRESWM